MSHMGWGLALGGACLATLGAGGYFYANDYGSREGRRHLNAALESTPGIRNHGWKSARYDVLSDEFTLSGLRLELVGGKELEFPLIRLGDIGRGLRSFDRASLTVEGTLTADRAVAVLGEHDPKIRTDYFRHSPMLPLNGRVVGSFALDDEDRGLKVRLEGLAPSAGAIAASLEFQGVSMAMLKSLASSLRSLGAASGPSLESLNVLSKVSLRRARVEVQDNGLLKSLVATSDGGSILHTANNLICKPLGIAFESCREWVVLLSSGQRVEVDAGITKPIGLVDLVMNGSKMISMKRNVTRTPWPGLKSLDCETSFLEIPAGADPVCGYRLVQDQSNSISSCHGAPSLLRDGKAVSLANIVRLAQGSHCYDALRWLTLSPASPSGRYRLLDAATDNSSRVDLLDSKEGRIVDVPRVFALGPSVAWSPDEAFVAYAINSNESNFEFRGILVVNVATGANELIPELVANPWSLRFTGPRRLEASGSVCGAPYTEHRRCVETAHARATPMTFTIDDRGLMENVRNQKSPLFHIACPKEVKECRH